MVSRRHRTQKRKLLLLNGHIFQIRTIRLYCDSLLILQASNFHNLLRFDNKGIQLVKNLLQPSQWILFWKNWPNVMTSCQSISYDGRLAWSGDCHDASSVNTRHWRCCVVCLLWGADMHCWDTDVILFMSLYQYFGLKLVNTPKQENSLHSLTWPLASVTPNKDYYYGMKNWKKLLKNYLKINHIS